MRLIPLIYLLLCSALLCSATSAGKRNLRAKNKQVTPSNEEDVDRTETPAIADNPPRTRSRALPSRSQPQPEPPANQPPPYQQTAGYNSLTSDQRGLLHLAMNIDPVMDPFYQTPSPAQRKGLAEDPPMHADHEIHPWYEFNHDKRRTGIWHALNKIIALLRDVSYIHGGTYLFYYGRPEESPVKTSEQVFGHQQISRNIAVDTELKAIADELFESFIDDIAKRARAQYQDRVKRARALQTQLLYQSFDQAAEEHHRKRQMREGGSVAGTSGAEVESSQSAPLSSTAALEGSQAGSAEPERSKVDKGKGKAAAPASDAAQPDGEHKSDGDDEEDGRADGEGDDTEEAEFPGLREAIGLSRRQYRAPGTAGSSSRLHDDSGFVVPHAHGAGAGNLRLPLPVVNRAPSAPDNGREAPSPPAAAHGGHDAQSPHRGLETRWTPAPSFRGDSPPPPPRAGTSSRSSSDSSAGDPRVPGHVGTTHSGEREPGAQPATANPAPAKYPNAGAAFDAAYRRQRALARDDSIVPDSQASTPEPAADRPAHGDSVSDSQTGTPAPAAVGSPRNSPTVSDSRTGTPPPAAMAPARDDSMASQAQARPPAAAARRPSVISISSDEGEEFNVVTLPAEVRRFLLSPRCDDIEHESWARIEGIWRSGMTAPDRMLYYETQLATSLKLNPRGRQLQTLTLLLLRHNP